MLINVGRGVFLADLFSHTFSTFRYFRSSRQRVRCKRVMFMPQPYRLFLLPVILLLINVGDVRAELALPSIFSDHMVLQRDHTVPVWGTATPGAEVSVAFWGQCRTTQVDQDGQWRIELEPMDVSAESREMRITSSRDDEVLIRDVLVGEVWLCSGQSNMHYSLKALSTQHGAATPIADEIPKAEYPLIRQMHVYSTLAPDEPQSDVGGKWQVCSPDTVSGFSGTAYFFARELYRELEMPIGIIRCSWSGSPIQAWTRREILMENPVERAYTAAKDEAELDFDLAAAEREIEQWKAEHPGKTPPKRITRLALSPSETAHYPQTLYNGMLSPVMTYAIRGVIWYQGEANGIADQSRSYHWTFSRMIEDWRKQWGQGDFPFYFVQLANFRAPSERPLDLDHWANLRESQLKTLSVSQTGMAIAIDIGEAEDVHPRNKIEVGRRLARLALASDYGREIVSSGPLYSAAEFEGSKAVIRFDHVAEGLMVGHKEDLWSPVEAVDSPLTYFQICGADRKWKWAQARIVDSDRVEVWNDAIAEPVAVRYAWASNPEGCNLYNSAGLPASPFRTDSW